jgi:2-aminoethylphosphonate-pyruvate transaminase
MGRDAADRILLIPGPVSTSQSVKQAMMIDRPFGGPEILEDLAFARQYLVSLVHGEGRYVALPLPGSATYSNEAVLAALVPPSGKVLIHSNGVYGDRLIDIAAYLGKPHAILRTAPTEPPTGEQVAQAIADDPAITHVFVVHCETSVGILNPIAEIAQACQRLGKGLLIDAVASFGAVEIDSRTLPFDALTISSNKCLQGVPGLGSSIVRKAALENAKKNCPSLVIDLWTQLQQLESIGAMRFTPPTQVLAAFAQACREHQAEGGTAARGSRYRRNWRRLVDGMRQLGFQTVVPDAYAAPIVAAFHNPAHPAFKFDALYEGMKRRGFIIFPGRVAVPNTFRIGCMGDVHEQDLADAVQAVAETLKEMGATGVGQVETVE